MESKPSPFSKKKLSVLRVSFAKNTPSSLETQSSQEKNRISKNKVENSNGPERGSKSGGSSNLKGSILGVKLEKRPLNTDQLSIQEGKEKIKSFRKENIVNEGISNPRRIGNSDKAKMTNKSSTFSKQELSVVKVFYVRNSQPVLETHSSQKGKKKMKFFRKVGECAQIKMAMLLRKRRYRLLSLTNRKVTQNGSQYSHILKQVFKHIKSLIVFKTSSQKLFKKRISSLKNLKSLETKWVEKKTDVEVKRFVKHASNNLHSLRCLKLGSGKSHKLTDMGVKHLAEQIGDYLQSLKYLHLYFFENQNITDAGIISLAENIGNNLKGLRRLHLDFFQVQNITNAGVKKLTEEIGNNLKSLRGLFFRFSMNDHITDAGIVSLAKNIGDNLQSLRYLVLEFSNLEEITNIGIQSLAIHIGNGLQSLRYLELNLMGTLKVTDKVIISLGEQIGKNLKSLQDLRLHFTCVLNLTDVGVKGLVEHLRGNLKSLSLAFDGYDYVTDAGVKVLGEQIGKNLKALQALKLKFSSKDSVTDTGLKKLAVPIVANLKSLQYLDLCFDSCAVTRYQAEKSEKQIRASLKSLIHCRVSVKI